MAPRKSMKKSIVHSTYSRHLFAFPFYRRVVLALGMFAVLGVGGVVGAIFKLHHNIQSLFSTVQIGDERVIGYAQYFNYPIYYEHILFLGFLILPFFIFGIIWLLERHKQ